MNTPAADNAGSQSATRKLLQQALLVHTQGRLDEAEAIYRQVLTLDPDDHNALTNIGTVFLQRGQLGEGVPFLERSLRIKADQPNALANLGNALTMLGRFEEALNACRRAIEVQPQSHDAHNNLANVLRELQRPEEALEAYDRALALKPDFAVALKNQGNLLRNLGRQDEALEVLDRATDLGDAQAINERANVLAELNQGDAALAAYDQALAIDPGLAEAWSNKIVVLQRMERLDEALEAGERAIALRPDYADALFNTANVLAGLKRFDDALPLFDRAIALRPNQVEAYNNRGAALVELKRLDEALADLDRANRLQPNQAQTIANRGNILRALGRLEEALETYRDAATQNPAYMDALNNIATVLTDLRRPEEALQALEQALSVDPQCSESLWNKSLVSLLTQRYSVGWELYEWRWRQPGWGEGLPPLGPQWLDKADLAGKTLLVRAEQGFGDTLQALRYAPMLADRGIRVILAVQKPLGDIARRVRGVSQVIVEGEAMPPFDFTCMIMSLPLGFETTADTVPGDVPYLSVDPEFKNKWAAKLGPRTRPRVGIVWSGSPSHKNDASRSIPLSTFLPVIDANPDVEFHSLQLEYRPADEALLQAHGGIRTWNTELKSFMDTGGLIEQMDMVISVDTSVAHLAGALGKPLWLLITWIPDYRWHLDTEASPWYPTARLFRQPQRKDWDSVVQRVGGELKALTWRTGWDSNPR